MPMSLSAQIQKQTLKPETNSLYDTWFPRIGLSLDWAGLVCGVQLQPHGLKIGVDQSKKSKLARWDFLPRSSFYLQIQKYKVLGRTAPIVETVMNLKNQPRTWANFTSVVLQQLDEVPSADQVWNKVNKSRLKTAKKPQLTA